MPQPSHRMRSTATTAPGWMPLFPPRLTMLMASATSQMKVETSCGARRSQPNSKCKKGHKRTAGAKAMPIIHVIS